MLHASTQRLIHKLCALTESGDIAWREGEGGVLAFDTEGYRVEVQGEPPSLRLLRNDGKELESATSSDLAATPWPDGEGTFAVHVTQMARQASRTVREADVAISRILSSLSAPPHKEPGPPSASLAAEPPPSPHTVPEPPVQPHAETAVGKPFSVNQDAAADAIESAPVEPDAEKAVEAAEEELPLEEAPEPMAAQAEPVEPPRPPLPEPQFRTPEFAAPEPPLAYAPVREGFGEIKSFAIARRAAPKPESLPATVLQPTPPLPPPEPPIEPKVTSTGLFISSVSAVSRQTVRGEIPPERAAPAPAPKVQTPPAPEPKREPATATGADIYKPWV